MTTAVGRISPVTFRTTETRVNVYQIESISEISKNQPFGTIYLFDIDDTLMDHEGMAGSEAWRDYIRKETPGYGTAGSFHDKASLFLAENHPVTTVELETAQWLSKVQENYEAYGFTARERNRWYYTPREGVDVLTVAQLSSVGINFDHNFESGIRDHFATFPEFFKGVLFSDLDSKGDYVEKLFGGTCLRPIKVVFIDNKGKHAYEVAQALSQFGIDHECYWYRAIEKKSKEFNVLIGNIQLYHAYRGKVLSNEEAEAIAKENSEKGAMEYLQNID